MGRNRLYPVVTLLGLAVNVGLNVVLIPAWEETGASLATLVTEALMVTLLMVPVARMDVLRPLPIGRAGLAVAAGGLGALVAVLVRQALPWPVAAGAAAATYGVAVHVLRVPGPQGWRTLLAEGPATD